MIHTYLFIYSFNIAVAVAVVSFGAVSQEYGSCSCSAPAPAPLPRGLRPTARLSECCRSLLSLALGIRSIRVKTEFRDRKFFFHHRYLLPPTGRPARAPPYPRIAPHSPCVAPSVAVARVNPPLGERKHVHFHLVYLRVCILRRNKIRVVSDVTPAGASAAIPRCRRWVAAWRPSASRPHRLRHRAAAPRIASFGTCSPAPSSSDSLSIGALGYLASCGLASAATGGVLLTCLLLPPGPVTGPSSYTEIAGEMDTSAGERPLEICKSSHACTESHGLPPATSELEQAVTGQKQRQNVGSFRRRPGRIAAGLHRRRLGRRVNCHDHVGIRKCSQRNTDMEHRGGEATPPAAPAAPFQPACQPATSAQNSRSDLDRGVKPAEASAKAKNRSTITLREVQTSVRLYCPLHAAVP
ncbi:hypothetical protein EVAR_3174_1 [Eumeta japonica]|uniref:Uncharacterized protein n=1 Tax=Eumeta variegata TaxID=151549 RepID=A0A4C1XHL4_EUMVA|nr:hypothetical protein EVAR_3174_1 [Eumeta japonica]